MTQTAFTETPIALSQTSDAATVEDPSMGIPLPDWEGIPVIPGAIEGTPAGFSYTYSVNVTMDEAEQFYLNALESTGWALSSRQTGDNGLFGGLLTILDFQRNSEAFNITLVDSANDDNTMVMLTRVKP